MGQGYRCGVGTPPAEECHVVISGNALGAADHRDPALIQGGPNPVRADLEDPGVHVVGVGQESGLATGERVGRDTGLVNSHAQEGHGLPLTRRDQHVHLTARASTRHAVGEAKEVVGLLTHGRHHHHHAVTGSNTPGDMVGHGSDPVWIAHRGAAELLDQQCHGPPRYRGCPRRICRISDDRRQVVRLPGRGLQSPPTGAVPQPIHQPHPPPGRGVGVHPAGQWNRGGPGQRR